MKHMKLAIDIRVANASGRHYISSSEDLIVCINRLKDLKLPCIA